MLGRRRHDAGGTATAVGIPAQRGGVHDLLAEFRLSENPATYPSTHPDHPGYRIYFTFKSGGEVTIETPEHPTTTSPVFRLLDLEVGSWTKLVDPDGRPIPVELRFQDGLGGARWL